MWCNVLRRAFNQAIRMGHCALLLYQICHIRNTVWIPGNIFQEYKPMPRKMLDHWEPHTTSWWSYVECHHQRGLKNNHHFRQWVIILISTSQSIFVSAILNLEKFVQCCNLLAFYPTWLNTSCLKWEFMLVCSCPKMIGWKNIYVYFERG